MTVLMNAEQNNHAMNDRIGACNTWLILFGGLFSASSDLTTHRPTTILNQQLIIQTRDDWHSYQDRYNFITVHRSWST